METRSLLVSLSLLLLLSLLQESSSEVFLNVAYRKPCSQRPSVAGGHAAAQAVDGLLDPDPDHGYCALSRASGVATCSEFGWWMVDLGKTYAIDYLLVYSRTTSTEAHQLGYTSVRVSNSDNILDHVDECVSYDKADFPEAQGHNLRCRELMYGRFVSIQKTRGRTSYIKEFTLCEVQVFGRDIATDCSKCSDSGCTPDKFCNTCEIGWRLPECRKKCPEGTWGVNCANKCSEGCIINCEPETGNCWRCKNGWIGIDCADVTCLDLPGYQPPDCTEKCVPGTYGLNCANDCSLKCIGACDVVDGYCDRENLALGQPTLMNDVYWTLTSDLAVDGIIDPIIENRKCAATYRTRIGTTASSCSEIGWWMVDLGSHAEVQSITIYNSEDVPDLAENSLTDLSVQVGETRDINEHTTLCKAWDQGKIPFEGSRTLTCDPGVIGRYLSIKRNGGTDQFLMVLCEVIVRGKRVIVPEITHAGPLYGPAWGGTQLVLLGRDLLEQGVLPVVEIGNSGCQILDYKEDRIDIVTPPLLRTQDVGQQMLITLKSPNRVTVQYKLPFVYRANPVISRIYPIQINAIGGVGITIDGENLDSSYKSYLKVYVDVLGSGRTSFENECNTAKSRQMICPSPQIPTKNLDHSRKRRDVDDEELLAELASTRGTYGVGQDGGRNDDLSKHPSPAVRRNSTIRIINDDPDIPRWDGVKQFTGGSITIEGKGIGAGFKPDDWEATITGITCTDEDLRVNSLLCRPPEDEPSNSSIEGHTVLLHRGIDRDHTYFIGYLEYTKKNWYDDPLVLGGIAAGGFLLILIIVVPVCVCCCRKRQRRKRLAKRLQRSTEMTQQAAGNGQPGRPKQTVFHDLEARRQGRGRGKPLPIDAGYLPQVNPNYEKPVAQQGYTRPAATGGDYFVPDDPYDNARR